MSTRIVLRPQAERDLDAQAAYIGRRSPAAAARLLDAARDIEGILADERQ